ncbi:MAG: aldose 1-epimerase family protein [Sphingomonadales bacterium]|nr:aldose 1-epimerase family protein [Sphingomonadales bacterium]
MEQALAGATSRVAIGRDAGFRAEIDPLGAQLMRLRDRNGRDLLWDGDPAFWTGRAPVLFPIVGSLRDNRYRYRGRDYSLPRHGFARTLPWQVVDHGDDRATLRLRANAATLAHYPFAFELVLTFTTSDSALAVTVAVSNAGEDVMPFSFGFHPALRWPFAGGARGDYRLRFDRAEPELIARVDGAGLIARHEASPVHGHDLPLDDSLFVDDALVFAGLSSGAVEYGIPGGDQLRVEFPRFPDLGVWTKPGAGYLCIEPWLGHADPVAPYGEIFAKPGIRALPPGQGWGATMTIALLAEGGRP